MKSTKGSEGVWRRLSPRGPRELEIPSSVIILLAIVLLEEEDVVLCRKARIDYERISPVQKLGDRGHLDPDLQCHLP